MLVIEIKSINQSIIFKISFVTWSTCIVYYKSTVIAKEIWGDQQLKVVFPSWGIKLF